MSAPQGSAEWLAERTGKVTASKVAAVMATTRAGAPTAERGNYLRQLVGERLTGMAAQTFVNFAMRQGTEREPAARSLYAIERGVMVEEVGFVQHPAIPGFGASPDGLVDDDGLVEIKCPMLETAVGWLMDGEVPAQHIPQMQAQMTCTGRQWCDLAVYQPDLPDDLALRVWRLERDDTAIAEMEEAVVAFLAEVDGAVARLRTAREEPEDDPIDDLIRGRIGMSMSG